MSPGGNSSLTELEINVKAERNLRSKFSSPRSGCGLDIALSFCYDNFTPGGHYDFSPSSSY